jgi:hypothetical protein
MTDDASLGEVAYAAYGRTTNHLNYQGLPMPAWTDLGDTIRQAWENAAEMVQKVTNNPMTAAAAQTRANYADVWAELVGWVQEAEAENERIDPAQLLGYLRELKQRATAPMRDWMSATMAGGSDER